MTVNHGYTATPGPKLHYVTGGSGRPVLLLHGFPDFWYGWNHQIEALMSAGYHVIAPDQRGYNLSDKPSGVGAYRIGELAADVLRLADEVAPGQRISLVGHDWGAAVAWWIAIERPERLDRLAILNVPHPLIFEQTLMRNPRQLMRSWYAGVFQIPALPERLLAANDWQGMRLALRATAHRDTFSRADLALYREAWSQPGVITAMLNWYRAAARYRPRLPAIPRVHVPTLVLWGAEDVALGRDMAEPSQAMCDDGRLVFFEQASHWVHRDEPQRVNELLLRFLEAGTAEA